MSSWKPSPKNIYLRLWNLVAPFKGWVIFSILCMGGYNIFSAAPAYYAKDIVDALAYGDKPELSQFFLVGFGLILIFFLQGCLPLWKQLRVGSSNPKIVNQAAAGSLRSPTHTQFFLLLPLQNWRLDVALHQ